jgi:hypothetical protein
MSAHSVDERKMVDTRILRVIHTIHPCLIIEVSELFPEASKVWSAKPDKSEPKLLFVMRVN